MRAGRGWLVSVAVCLLPLFTPSRAAGQAQPSQSSQPPAAGHKRDPSAAEALFRDARHLMAEGKYAEACPKLVESEGLDPATGTVLNIADCEEKLGNLATAWENWHRALDELSAGDERIKLAEQHAAALEPRLPHLRLHLGPNAPPGTYARRDAVDLHEASFDVPLPVDPGQHDLTFLADGYQAATQKVSLTEGQTLTVEVAPGPLIPPGQGGAVSPASSSLRVAGWITAGVGVAGFIGAAVTGGIILHDKSTAEAECQPNCMMGGASAVNSGRTMLPVNAVFWGVGVAGVAGGATMIVLGRKRRGEPAATVGAALQPGGGGVLVKGTF
jgi:hypothetical protein